MLYHNLLFLQVGSPLLLHIEKNFPMTEIHYVVSAKELTLLFNLPMLSFRVTYVKCNCRINLNFSHYHYHFYLLFYRSFPVAKFSNFVIFNFALVCFSVLLLNYLCFYTASVLHLVQHIYSKA